MTRRSWIVLAVLVSPVTLASKDQNGAGDAAAADKGGEHFDVTESLSSSDSRLTSGEYYDVWEIQVVAGQEIDARITSSDFDTFLVVQSPSSENTQNDDWDGKKSESRLRMTAEESGTWRVFATSYKPEEAGAYHILIDVRGGEPARGAGAGEAMRFSGTLDSGDATLASGEYYEIHSFEAAKGQQVVVDMRSTAFDPYVGLRSPSDETWENDDYEGDSARSLVSMDLPESGTYKIVATSYKPDMVGTYDISVRLDHGEEHVATGKRVERGELQDGDQTLRNGEYADVFEFVGRPGMHVNLDVESTAFDTFLILAPPVGDNVENDDAEGAAGHSVIDTVLNEAGTYRIAVTSFKPGETGRYTLTIDQKEGTSATHSTQRDVTMLTSGVQVSGTLSEGDSKLETGEFKDTWVFDGVAGQNLSVRMQSGAFDPYVGVIPPGGGPIENDDLDGQRDTAGVDFALPESGRYRVVSTSYQAGETGDYNLVMTLGGESQVQPPRVHEASNPGRTFGVFVGISDYPGEDGDLSYTADDARAMYSAFATAAGMQVDHGVILTDSQATIEGVKGAVARLGAQMNPEDSFIFFYSGHGGRVKRDGWQSADPDGQDETLALYDGHLLDDAFSEVLDGVGAGTTLIVLDACFSGGFAKDIISKPGRMGLFSSEEDVTSAVAAKFRAGGYLARFVAEGIGEGYADDGDGNLTAIELSSYLHERYRSDVKSAWSPGGGTSDIVMVSRNLGYQHLVVDRGSIQPFQVLWSW